jgi:GT2 family glycosyltransferase
MAVDREIFLKLGGFDPLYLPGRIEDLDFCYRAFMAGYHAKYVPQAVAYHKGQATFGREFTAAGCDRLALRNTLLFQWKNLRRTGHRLRQGAGTALRLLRDFALAPWRRGGERLPFWTAYRQARRRRSQIVPTAAQSSSREREFFRRFHPHCINSLT